MSDGGWVELARLFWEEHESSRNQLLVMADFARIVAETQEKLIWAGWMGTGITFPNESELRAAVRERIGKDEAR